MKGFNFLPGKAFMLSHYSFNRNLNIRLLEPNKNTFSQSLLLNFSTLHFLLKEKESSENKSKNSTVEKRQEVRTSLANASKSSGEKKKTVNKIKSLILRPGISNNDLQIKVKQIEKFINKGITVAVKVDNPKNLENAYETVFSQIEKSLIELEISAKVTKTGPIINIYPISNKTDKKVEKMNNSTDFIAEKENHDKIS